MGHEITATDTVATTRGREWWGDGLLIPEGLTARAAVSLALPWEPEEGEVRVLWQGRWIEAPDFKGIIRNDTGEVLAVPSKGYQPVPNRLLAEFTDALDRADRADGSSGVAVKTAGSLNGGRRVFICCKLVSTQHLANGDKIEDYLLITNDHTGAGALRAYFTRVRVVCANTWRLAESLAGARGFWYRHDGNLMVKLEEAKRLLGLAGDAARDAHEEARRMRDVSLTVSEVDDYFADVFRQTFGERRHELTKAQSTQAAGNGDGEDAVAKLLDEVNAKYDEKRGLVLAQWNENHENDIARGSVWGAFNAVTEYHDHQRGRGKPQERKMTKSRMHSNLFGVSARDKQVAHALAVQLIDS